MTILTPLACAEPLLPVVGGETEVPLLPHGRTRYVNLDYAASAPALASVAAHVADVLPYYSSVHRGAGYHSQVSTALYEQARSDVAEFVGADQDDVLIFTRNTTDSLNLLASAVPGEVVVLDVEHHANLLPWQRYDARVVEAEPTVRATLAALEDELRSSPAALVAVTGASNVTGESLPLDRVAAIAHRHGARLAVDGAQLVPHRRVDITAAGIDYLAFSGHKLYAPFGAGVLVGQRDWLDSAAPYLAGGGAVRHVRTTETEWGNCPARHEGGSPNTVGAAALAQACRDIAALPERAIIDHEAALRSELVAGLDRLGIDHARIWSDSAEPVGIVTFAVDGYTAEQVAAYLSAEHGIGVRDGRFCAHPLLDRLGRPHGAVRASFGLGSRRQDVTALVDALAQLLANGTGWTYETVPEGVVPVPELRCGPGSLGEIELPTCGGQAVCRLDVTAQQQAS